MNTRTAWLIVVLAGLAVGGPSRSAQAGEIDCRVVRWSDGQPAINLRHIFCGEIRGHADGYHSEALGTTPLVAGVAERSEREHGIYEGTVLFADGERKSSTFYPRSCSVAQIVASIRYAVRQPVVAKRGRWGDVALSAPLGATAAEGYCLGSDGQPFTIRYSRLSRGDVNTAFPDLP